MSESGGELGFSLKRSLVTPYAPFTVYVLAYTLFGIALGSVYGAFDPVRAAAVCVAIWFGLEGLHAIDLADEGVATRMDNRVANVLGYSQVIAGSAIGVWLASQTTWWFLALVGAGALLGLAYNEEWFGGWLHDRDKITGLANFGVSWGAVPFYAGFAVVNQSVTLGAVVVAAGVGVDAMRLNYLEGHGRIARYETVDIEHSRGHKSTGDEAREACHTANLYNLVAWVGIGLGTAVMFVI